MILLTHPPQVRENYYSDKALAGPKALAEVRRNPLERELSTAEWVLGAMIDLGRRISISTEDYHAGKVPASVMGRQLQGATLGVIDDGRIAGCAMDVGCAADQMPSPALARHPRVIATPHIGGLTPQATEHQALETVAQVAEILKGRVPKGAVNAEHATRLKLLR